MKKILVVFHDPNIRSGATASMLTIMDALINNDDIIVEALIPHKTGELFSILKEKKLLYISINIIHAGITVIPRLYLYQSDILKLF
jgi:hypothetical protein